MNLSPTLLRIAIVMLCCSLLPACSQSRMREVNNGPPVDLSGHWELDYSQSDNIQVELNALVRNLRRQAEQRSQGAMNQRGGSGIALGDSGINSGPSIMGLAQMADLVTRSPLLEIEQDDHDIKVKREENFALSCEFYVGQLHTVETSLGSEICGWSAHQLVFRLLLPEGLSIQHILTMEPSGARLNIATTVHSDRVSRPFTLNRVYNRYEPRSNGITCKMTISRGRVCTTESS